MGNNESDSRKSLEKVRKRKMTGRDFLIQECDEKLWDEDFNDEANGFAKDYYEANSYLEDYKKILKANLPTLYHVEDTWENYDNSKYYKLAI